MSFHPVQSSPNFRVIRARGRAALLLTGALAFGSACELQDDSVAQTAATAGSGGSAAAGSGGSTASTAATSGGLSSAGAEDGHVATHEAADDYAYSADDVVQLTLSEQGIQLPESAAQRVTLSGTTATITQPGTYRLVGSASDAQVRVQSSGTVRLLLGGIALGSRTGSPLSVLAADKVVILIEDGTQNTLTDAMSYAVTDGPNAALYSQSNLTLHGSGTGTLTVNANYADGINSKAGLVVDGARLSVTAAVDDGIRGKDYLVVKGGSHLTVDAAGDGLKSDYESDASRGYVTIDDGEHTIRAGTDALQAASDLLVRAGTFRIQAGGKGLKATRYLAVRGGSFTLDTADDGLHSNTYVVVDAGDFEIQAGDDGVHAEKSLTIHGGTLNIAKCVEGIESATITLDDGEVHIVSSDDGVNVANGEDTSGAVIAADHLYINDGYLVVDAAGDGIDVNASITMLGGTLIVQGPTAQDNGALDYDGTFDLRGGTLVAVGSGGMAMAPSASSTQPSLKLGYGSASSSSARTAPGAMGFGAPGGSGATIAAGGLVHLQSSDGKDLLTFVPEKAWGSLVFSSPSLTSGLTGGFYTGGSSTGSLLDGLYQGGTYSDGTLRASFTLSGSVTALSFE